MAQVSVVLPVYDDLAYVERAVGSVLGQGHDEIEIVVVHSGDPSSFPEHVREQSAVTYLHQAPQGVAAARNSGLDAASGDVVGFCDADDCWHPDKLEAQLPLLRSGADVVYSDEYLVRDGTVRHIESLPVRDPENHHVDYFRKGGVGSRSVLARADCFERERFDERFTVREDPHLWTRLFERFSPARVPEPLSYKHVTPNSLSSDVDQVYRMERLEIEDLCERYPELRPVRAERERTSRYRHAKRLLAVDGRAAEARRVLRALLREDPTAGRVWALLLLSALPAGNQWATRRVQDSFWALRSYRRRLFGDDLGAEVSSDGDPTDGPLDPECDRSMEPVSGGDAADSVSGDASPGRTN